jgi:uncharacterized protein (DUF885 family)
MKHVQTLLATVFFGLACSTAIAKQPQAPDASTQLNQLFDDYFERSLALNPLQATFIGDHRYDDRLANDLSPQHRAQALSLDRQFLATATGFQKRELPDADRLSLEIFIANLGRSIEGAQFPSELAPIHQLSSLPTTMPILASGNSAQPFRTTQDYERFLQRLRDYVVWSDQAIANMREGLRRNVTYPRILMGRVQAQLASLTVADPHKSPFYQALTRFPDAVPAADRARLEEAYRKAIAQEINPSYQRLHDFIRDEYIPGARTADGWSSMPDGARWYAYLARAATTTDLSPDRIHELGLREVARIRAEMEQVKTQVGFQGDLSAFFKFLQDDPQFYFDDEESLLQGYRTLEKTIDGRLPQMFSRFPKSEYEVRAVEPFRARSTPAASYQPAAPDGSRPGILYINTFNLKAQPKFSLETLSLHEGAPGHHFQVSLQQELQSLPRFRRFGGGYVAYQEGWGMYCEGLGKELGLFNDPYEYYGRLSYEMLRAMRLVVDTGLHTRGWTREQAIRYMLENSSMAASDAEAEVERYLAIPGQALGYKIGQIRIAELRERAQAALGSSFDLREFHNEVLRDGALPLAVLEKKIDRWIASRKGAATR